MLAYREWGRKKGITKPNIVAPSISHAAFEKACFYFGIELRKIPQKKNFTTDVERMRSHIDSNTVCLVANCPDFGYGICDPVPEIASLALK